MKYTDLAKTILSSPFEVSTACRFWIHRTTSLRSERILCILLHLYLSNIKLIANLYSIFPDSKRLLAFAVTANIAIDIVHVGNACENIFRFRTSRVHEWRWNQMEVSSFAWTSLTQNIYQCIHMYVNPAKLNDIGNSHAKCGIFMETFVSVRMSVCCNSIASFSRADFTCSAFQHRCSSISHSLSQSTIILSGCHWCICWFVYSFFPRFFFVENVLLLSFACNLVKSHRYDDIASIFPLNFVWYWIDFV